MTTTQAILTCVVLVGMSAIAYIVFKTVQAEREDAVYTEELKEARKQSKVLDKNGDVDIYHIEKY